MGYRNSTYASGVTNIYWFEKNLQGDIIAVYNENATLLVSYTYDAWGKPTASTPTYYNGGESTAAQYNPFRYRGYYYDSELGFYYLNSRYYDPETDRFVSADTLMSGTDDILDKNTFVYYDNSPCDVTAHSGTLLSTQTHKRSYGIFSVDMIANMTVGSTGANDTVPSPAVIRDVTKEIDAALTKQVQVIKKIVKKANILISPPVKRVYLYKEFYKLVNHGMPWDIKDPDSWKQTIGTPFPGTISTPVYYHNMIMTPESLGNYTYGYLGACFDFSLLELLGGSYYAAGFPNEGDALVNEACDWVYILMGYNAYN